MFNKKTEYKLSVEGMMCQNCVAHVTKALGSVPGVLKVNISLEDKTATVTVSEPMDAGVLAEAVIREGYKASVM